MMSMMSADFSTLGAASIHEARCRLKVGEKPAFECRKFGMRLQGGDPSFASCLAADGCRCRQSGGSAPD